MLTANQIDTPLCSCCKSTSKTFLHHVYDHEYHTTEQQFPLNKCNECGLIYLSPRPNQNALDIIYPISYNNFHTRVDDEISYVQKVTNFLQSLRLKKLIHKYFPKRHAIKVLDVGCGDGFILDRIKSTFSDFKTYGVEPNKYAAEWAGKNHDVYCGLIEDYHTQTKFDLITSSHVIEHVSDPLGFLIKLKSMLNENGILIIDTPNIDCLQYKIFGKYWGGIHAPRHWTLFSVKTLQETARRAGLETLDIRQMPINVFWIWSIHSMLYQFPKLRVFADKFFDPVKCSSKKSYYYFFLIVISELLDRIVKFFGLGVGQQRAIFIKNKYD